MLFNTQLNCYFVFFIILEVKTSKKYCTHIKNIETSFIFIARLLLSLR